MCVIRRVCCCQVHEVQVTANSIVPDPCSVNLNDVVAWSFRTLRQNDVQLANTVDKLIDAQLATHEVSPRYVQQCVSPFLQAKNCVGVCSLTCVQQCVR